MKTRYAVMVGDMVVGDGATEDDANKDALSFALDHDVLASIKREARMVEYDSDTHEVALHGGLVVLLPK